MGIGYRLGIDIGGTFTDLALIATRAGACGSARS